MADEDLINVSDLEGHSLYFHWMSGSESLGGLFEYEVEVASKESDIKANEVLGKKLTITIPMRSGGDRCFNGHVTSWTFRGVRNDRIIYHLTLHPWLWFLGLTSDCRVFNTSSALDIAKRIFAKYRAEADFEASALTPEYPAYEYLVQYRESDLNLVLRLFQDEGIYFFFRHQADNHTLVLADGLSAHGEAAGYKEILYRPPTEAGHEVTPHFDRYSFRQDIQLRTYCHDDYLFQNPHSALLASGQSDPEQARYGTGECFDYPGRFSSAERGRTLAAVRLGAYHQPAEVIELGGNPVGLGVGNLFTLSNPPWNPNPLDFLVTSAHYELRQPEERSGGRWGDDEPFRATYTVQPKKVQFRSPRTATKPPVLGPQTAVVVGRKKNIDKDPEEIETDPDGRVRVRFHWERIADRHPDIRGPKDDEEESNTCWIRVAQMWAGSGWGSIYIPRIGQEVVVEFLEGDPDRPLITGGVYNGINKPPYTLPTNKTQSGIKSRSTKSGNAQNFNEIRFEDLKGKEELHMQAERDMSTHVKRNQSTTVDGDRSVSVGGNHTVSVTGTQGTTVTKDETQTYKANRKMTVTATNTDEITGAHKGTYHAGRTETVEKGDGDTLTVVGANKTVTVHGEYNSIADTQYKVTNGTNIIFMKGSDIVVNNSGCEVQLSGSDATVTAKASVTIKCGASSISMKSDGSIEITGVKVKIGNANNNAAFEPAGTTINGVKITSASVGMHEISGALIKVG